MNRNANCWQGARAVLACSLVLASTAAMATLGESATTVEADRARLQGERRVVQATATRLQTHVITQADGSTIKEFVTPDGVVFAVAWSTRFKPRLETLLGAHATRYASAARAAMVTPGIRHGVTLSSGDLVVQASAHLNAHVGLAYLRSLVPDGVHIDELR